MVIFSCDDLADYVLVIYMDEPVNLLGSKELGTNVLELHYVYVGKP